MKSPSSLYIKRAQSSIRALGLAAADEVRFQDVNRNAWYAKEIAAAYEAGIILGRGDGIFSPDDSISREEMAAMLVRVYEWKTGLETTGEASIVFEDQDVIAAWAEPFIARAVEASLMVGVGEQRFAPKAFVTRAQAAQAVYNLLQVLSN